MANAINPRPGDVFALPAHLGKGPPTPVTIARTTATQAIDADGGRWSLKWGAKLGSSTDHIRPWTDADTAAVEEHERATAYRRALDALGAAGYYWERLPTGLALAAALPHLRRAMEAMELATMPVVDRKPSP